RKSPRASTVNACWYRSRGYVVCQMRLAAPLLRPAESSPEGLSCVVVHLLKRSDRYARLAARANRLPQRAEASPRRATAARRWLVVRHRQRRDVPADGAAGHRSRPHLLLLALAGLRARQRQLHHDARRLRTRAARPSLLR